VALVQYTFTHKLYTEYKEKNIHNNKNKTKIVKCGPCPLFACYTRTQAFALKLRNRRGNTSVRVVETCPDIPVAVVQQIYTQTIHRTTQYIHRTTQ
jgi:hypothetical protein